MNGEELVLSRKKQSINQSRDDLHPDSYLSITCAKITCPFPQAPASWVPSVDHEILKTDPVFGFSREYDHCSKTPNDMIIVIYRTH